jgi:hypothetical protein
VLFCFDHPSRFGYVYTVSDIKREFHADIGYRYNRAGAGRWLLSHTFRYPVLPLLLVATSLVNNLAYSNIQVYVGKGFDVIAASGWKMADLVALALIILASAGLQGLTGMARNYSVELLAQRIERNTRERARHFTAVSVWAI